MPGGFVYSERRRDGGILNVLFDTTHQTQKARSQNNRLHPAAQLQRPDLMPEELQTYVPSTDIPYVPLPTQPSTSEISDPNDNVGPLPMQRFPFSPSLSLSLSR